MNEPIVLAGHSHATALGVYVDTPDFVHRLLPVRNEDPRFEGFTGFWPRQENYWNSLAKVVAGRRVALLWDGNQHNAIWLFSRGVVFDVALREMPELPIHPEDLDRVTREFEGAATASQRVIAAVAGQRVGA